MPSPQSNPGSASSLTLQQLRTILNPCPTPHAILQWNKILYINPAGKVLLGEEQAEQVFYANILGWSGDACPNAVSEKDRRIRIHALMQQNEQISISRKRWIRLDRRWTRQDNEELVLSVRAWPIPLEGGNGVQISFADITAETQEKYRTQAVLQKLGLAIDAASIGIWSYDVQTERFDCSRTCRQVLGVEWEEELSYQSFLKLVHPDDRPRFEYTLQHGLREENGGQCSCDYRLATTKEEPRWLASIGRVFFRSVDGNRKAVRVHGILLDITDLRQTEASLREKEKLAATGRLAASIAHEINNPLEAVTNLLYLLAHTELQPQQREYLTTTQQEIDRIIDITKLTLHFYRDPSPPAPCDLLEIVESVLVLFKNRIAALQIRVERRYGGEVSILGAREELRQVIMNLIQNSLDAMPYGGKLLVRTRTGTHSQDGRKGLYITIADTGKGIDPGIRTRIFEPFFTTHSMASTGLGLWMCAQVIEQHKGSIRVRSFQRNDKSGTVVSIFLPLDRRKRAKEGIRHSVASELQS